ncbi:MAG TPA: glycosyltransferase family 2 protein [bacterium]|nr:glycosyltransferase family 2 protein [bacterium]
MLRFSIVIPSLNQGRFIGDALRSIAGQNHPAVEVIIRDGGSTDDTAQVVKGFGPLVTAFVSERDSGQSDALNKGFAQATGDIFGWMNADDHYLPGAFAEAALIFEADPEITVVYGNWITIDEAGRSIRSHYALKARTPHFSYENLDSYNQALFWRRAAHERFGRFDEKLHRLMDDDLILALLRNEGPARFYRTDAFLGAFRVHEAQKTPDAEIDAKHRAEQEYLDKKYGFAAADSLRGKYYRLFYRWHQLIDSLVVGGLKYTIAKARSGLRKRGGVL